MKWTQKKLKPEMDKWVDAGLLPSSSVENILKRYPAEGANYWMIAFAVIGSVLCLGGVILIISHNWASTAPLTKMVALLGLLAASMGLGVESKSRHWHRAWWIRSIRNDRRREN